MNINMSYKLTVGGIVIEAKTSKEVAELVATLNGRRVRRTKEEMPEKKAVQEKKPVAPFGVKKNGIPKKRPTYPLWKEEHLKFLIDNADNKAALKSLPYSASAIKQRATAIRTGNMKFMSEPLKRAYEKWGSKSAGTQYLPN
jgi:hypothetical protein